MGQSSEEVGDRTSIVRFIEAEAQRFDKEASSVTSIFKPDVVNRLRDKASVLRTIAAQVARGDDRMPR